MPPPPQPPEVLRTPAVQQWTLANGLKVLFFERHDLPIVEGSLFIPGGGLWDRPEQNGAADAMGEQMRQGGAGRFGPDDLDLGLEQLAAVVESSFGDEFGKIEFRCLAADLPAVFEMYAAVVRRPRFDVSRLGLWKKNQVEAIRRRIDDPETIARLSSRQLLFPGSPQGRVVTSVEAEALQRSDLVQRHEYLVRPDDAILAVSGDTTAAELQRLLAQYFNEWERRGAPLPALSAPGPAFPPGVYFIEAPFSQSTVWLAEQGPPRNTPDEFAIRVFNQVFGESGLSSRVGQAIRVEAGLAYSVYGALLGQRVSGTALIAFQTKSEGTIEALTAAMKALRTMQAGGVSEDELDAAKRNLISSFVFKFDEAQKIAERKALVEILGYQPDFDAQYLTRAEGVQRSEVQEVARRYWNPEQFVVVAVGNAAAHRSLREFLASPQNVLPGMRMHEAVFKERLIVSRP